MRFSPRLFAAAEDLGLLVDFVLPEKEGAEDGAGFVFAEVLAALHDFLQDGPSRVERGGAVLAEIAESCIQPRCARAF